MTRNTWLLTHAVTAVRHRLALLFIQSSCVVLPVSTAEAVLLGAGTKEFVMSGGACSGAGM